MMNTYNCIGLMSGTSMDGVDLAHCTFTKNETGWHYTINAADCLPYSDEWQARLAHLPEQNAETFAKTNIYYGHFLGKCVAQFIKANKLEQTDFVSSHGQTIFHNPRMGYTIQIGSGASLAKECSLPVICDLRTSDMAYDGQGAPIVPLGERELFPEFSQFINIGGISNVAIHNKQSVIGYDVCMGNLLLDFYAKQNGQPFDKDGVIASRGKVIDELFNRLNEEEYLKKSPPKSLDRDKEFNNYLPIVETYTISLEDKMATIVDHIAYQLANSLQENKKVLITGGGALNKTLMKRLQHHYSGEVVVPDLEIIQYKEALIIAFLGVQRWLKQPNSLAQVTGAKKDTVNGAIYLP